MRIIGLLTMVMPVVFAFAFPIVGRWTPVNHTNIAIIVADGEVFGTMHNGGATVRMEANHDPETALVSLSDIRVVRRPSDWYNAAKYAPFIGIYRELNVKGAECTVCMEGDTAVVDVFLANKHYCFHLQNHSVSEC